MSGNHGQFDFSQFDFEAPMDSEPADAFAGINSPLLKNGNLENPGKEYACGAIAAITNILVVFPLHKTIFFQQLHGLRWLSATNKLYTDGLHNVYRGVLPPLLSKTSSLSMMFGIYAESNRLITDRHPNLSAFTRSVSSAVVAGIFECVLVPFERVQTLLQDSAHQTRYRHTWHAFRSIKKHFGMKEFYRGLTPVLVRNCVGNALYFEFKDIIQGKLKPSKESHIQLLKDLLCGAVLGASIGVITFPLNVAKTRMQCTVGNSYASMFQTLTIIYHERGQSIRRIYRGVPANCFRATISWSIITMTYEMTRRLLYSE